MKKIITLAFAIIMSVSVMAAGKATINFSVNPAMSCQNCENKIKSNLRFEKGVKEIATSLADQLVTVTYDPEKTSPEKLAEALKKIGYTATVSEKTAKKSCEKSGGCCKKDSQSGCCKKSAGECSKKNSKSACSKEKSKCGDKKTECKKDNSNSNCCNKK